MQPVKPPKISDPLLFEVYFAKFFPVEELVIKKIMKRTKYGITLTKEFKNLLLEKTKQVSSDSNTLTSLKNKRYSEIQLKKLWIPIVSAICSTHNFPYTIINKKAYVDKEHLNEVNLTASAVYIWFNHVQQIQRKKKLRKVKVKGRYV